MAHNPHQFPHEGHRIETGLRRSLFASLGIHFLLLALFAGVLFPGFRTPAPPTYTVDLVNLPVAHPRAGRPESQPRKEPATHKAKPKPKPEPKPPAVHHEQKSAPKVVLPTKTKPKPAPKPKPAQNDNRAYQNVVKQIEEMQKEKERQERIEALKRQLAQLAKTEAPPAPVAHAPVGMPTGHGEQEGVSYEAWIKQYVKNAWTLSRYQVPSLDLSAKVMLKFNAQGYLFDYNFIDSSGNKLFDDSVKKAFLPLAKRPLPTPPGKELDLEIIFDLKDLKD